MTTATPATTARSITFYTAAGAPLLDDDGIMTPPEIDSTVAEAFDLAPLANGSKVTVLFKGDGPDGFRRN